MSLVSIPLISHYYNLSIFQNNDISNWVTVIFAIPVGISVALIFYVLTKSREHDRMVKTSFLIHVQIRIIHKVLDNIKTQTQEGVKYNFSHDNEVIDTMDTCMNSIDNIYMSNSDALTHELIEQGVLHMMWNNLKRNIRMNKPEEELTSEFMKFEKEINDFDNIMMKRLIPSIDFKKLGTTEEEFKNFL